MSSVTQLKFKDDDNDVISVESIKIDIKGNGFLVTYTYDDGEEVEEVYLNKNLLLQDIKDHL